MPVVEVIQPAVRRAVATTRNGRVGVIGTVGTVHHYPRPGVVFVPIDDAPPIEVHLAWHRRHRHPFASRVARAIRTAYEEEALATLRGARETGGSPADATSALA